jgi:hypothetical protein
MQTSFIRVVASVAGALALVLIGGLPAGAHEHRGVAGHEVVVGWLDEPTFAGFKNGVQVLVNEPAGPGEAEGPPVEDADLQVEILFGGRDAQESMGPMPLEPAFGSPGEYTAAVIPTRPGRYTFHITGAIDDEGDTDEFFTSGPDTFSDVEDPTELEFPVQDPSNGQLADAVTGLQERNSDLQASLGDARKDADQARLLATVGIVVGLIGLVAAGAAFAGRRRTPA